MIVGGGPAGTSCAWQLCRAGLHVLVFDKKAFPRDKPCAGWITPQVVDALQFDIADYRCGRVWQPITGFRCSLMGGRDLEMLYDQPVSYGIRRCEFDTYLLTRTGAERQLSEPVRSLARKGNLWEINGRFSAPMLIGAGGHFCPVARHLGARTQSAASLVFAQEVEFPAENTRSNGGVQASVPEIYFCPDLAGYGWCFRKGDYLNIGLGRLHADRLPDHVTQFCNLLRERGRVHGDIPDSFTGHAYQLYERTVPKLYDDGVLLVGDAAGLAYPQSGEGIRPAVESGLIAAKVALSCGGEYGKDRLSRYESLLLARLGRPRRRSPTAVLPPGWLAFLASRLLATRWFTRRVVIERWFLHQHDAPLGGWTSGSESWATPAA